jgi:hypothetical protein
VVNQDLDHSITDHRCLKAHLQLRKGGSHMAHVQQHNVNYKPGDHSNLKQGTVRKLVNLEATTQRMLEATRVIDYPAFQYIDP